MDRTIYRPCGACVALVPSDVGCEHWRPHRKVVTSDRRRERNMQYKRDARERAKQAALR